MCWQCDHPDKTLDDYFDIVRESIRKHGWAIQGVEDPRAPYAYTIGLHQNALPELVVTGENPYRTARMLNTMARDALRGEPLGPGMQMTVPAGPLVEIVEVDHPDAHLDFAIALGGPDVRALQLVWADGRGRWPWSASFCDGRRRQPVLGLRAQAA